MLIELFSLDRAAEALRTIIGSKSAISLQRGPVDPKFQVEGVALTKHSFFSENWDKLSFVSCKNLNISFCRFVTIHASDGQTDGRTDCTDRRTEFSSQDRVCIPCSAVKTSITNKNCSYKNTLNVTHTKKKVSSKVIYF